MANMAKGPSLHPSVALILFIESSSLSVKYFWHESRQTIVWSEPDYAIDAADNNNVRLFTSIK